MFVLPAIFILFLLAFIIGMTAYLISNKIFGVPLTDAFKNIKIFSGYVGAKSGEGFRKNSKIILAVCLVGLFICLVLVFILLARKMV
jgi:hypothetical protein